MTGVLIERGNVDTDRTQREKDVRRHREKTGARCTQPRQTDFSFTSLRRNNLLNSNF